VQQLEVEWETLEEAFFSLHVLKRDAMPHFLRAMAN
jgi:hypothetical protein